MHIVVGTTTRARAGWSGLQIPAGTRDFSHLQNVETGFFGGLLRVLFNGYRGSFPVVKRPGRHVNHFYPAPTLRIGICTALPSVCLHSVNRESFTFKSLKTVCYRRYRAVADYSTIVQLEERAWQVTRRLSCWDVTQICILFSGSGRIYFSHSDPRLLAVDHKHYVC
jgi:hypothetical protein